MQIELKGQRVNHIKKESQNLEQPKVSQEASVEKKEDLSYKDKIQKYGKIYADLTDEKKMAQQSQTGDLAISLGPK